MPAYGSRDRRRTDEKIVPFSFHWSHDGNVYHNQFTGPVVSYAHRIVDTAMSDKVVKTYGFPAVNPCLHERCSGVLTPLEPFQGDHGSTITPLDGAYPSFSMSDVQLCVDPVSNPLRSQLCLEAFNVFSTQFPEKISFSEFLLGLGKLKELLPKLSGDILRDLASFHLGQKFGWENLLRDLQALSTVVQDVRSRLEWLKKTRGKPTRLGHYKRNVKEFVPVVVERNVWDRAFWTSLELVSYRVDFRAGAWLRQYLDHLDDMIGMLRGLMGALGLLNPVKAIWVNLPFSFVVDWFFNISAHLDRLALIKPAEEWNLYGVTHSFVYTAAIDVYQFCDVMHDPEVPRGQRKYRGRMYYEIYDRQCGLPISLDSLIPTGLSPNQLVLLAALFGSRYG